MSSLLQFSGDVGRRGVNLQFTYPQKFIFGAGRALLIACDAFTCPTCGETHGRIYTAWRKPIGMCGHWVVFRYNGEEHVPDLSIPIAVDRLPRDAKPLTDSECAAIWHGR